MSVRIMTRVWDAAFPTLPMKMIALKLADCANDEGENIYPSVGRVEAETGVCASVVRAALADLEAAGLLVVVAAGTGNRQGRSTTVRAFDVERLKMLGDGRLIWEQQDVIVRDHTSGEPKRHPDGSAKTRKAWRLAMATPPCDGGRDNPPPLRVTEGTPPCDGGEPLRVAEGTPPCDGGPYREPSIEPSLEPSIEPSRPHLLPSPPDDRSGTGECSGLKGAGGPSLVVLAGDLSWTAWLDHIERRRGPEARAVAEAAAGLRVPRRWPSADTPAEWGAP
jgi:hypothetical protein